jgi:UDP-N-acetylmuramate--alanine ligase
MFRGKVQTIHFVGIGGIGMSGIAEVLHNLGFTVTGSDLKAGLNVRHLRGMGVQVHVGHREENIGDADVVVRSTAVGEDNLEVAAAHRRQIPVIRRAEMLAELMRLKYGIAVAGTHGKTTTTSMLASVLAAGSMDPTVVIGGRVDSLGGTNAKLGEGDYLVAEADESDGTFLYLTPTVAIITNIDPEHLEHYGSFDTLQETFEVFANAVPFYGFSVLCLDHPVVQSLIPKIRRPVVTYGFSRQATYRAAALQRDGLTTSFEVHRGDEVLGQISLGMPGRHNIANALCACATAMELSVPFEVVRTALTGFTGVQRRFTVRAEVGGVLIVDDYGHHPVEIRATLQGAEGGFPDRRLIAVFQPHRYTRVQALYDEFCSAFNRAAQVVVCPIYPAGEKSIEGLDHRSLAEDIQNRGHHGVVVVDDLEGAVAYLSGEVRPGDLVITLGAGNVNEVCEALADRLGGGG